MHPLLMPLLLLSVALTACKGEAPEPGDSSELDDRDGDGALSDVDCDDDDAAVSPGAVEACDGIDNNCDGLIDDEDPAVDASGGVAVLVDGDGDGFGAEGGEVMRCVVPSGYATVEGDCDDGDDAVNPDAEEVCDERDNNCDGLVDDEDPSVNILSRWYPDADGDGFGNSDEGIKRCEMPSGYSAVEGDCDDGDAAVNPDAVEIPGNGVDDDCSSIVSWDFRFDTPADDIAGGDFNGDGYQDVIIGDEDDDYNKGAAYVYYGPITRHVDFDVEYRGEEKYDEAGGAVAAGDLDGDGFDELAIGGAGYDWDTETNVGIVAIRYGRSAKHSDSDYFYSIGPKFIGADGYDAVGGVIEFIGDVNGDGYDELAIHARGVVSSSGPSGAVYIIPGSATRYSGRTTAASAAMLTITPVADVLRPFQISDPIDLNGDGLNDLAMGWSAIDGEKSYEVTGVYIIYGATEILSTSVTISAASADASIIGDDFNAFGLSQNNAGDVNGDGYDDLVIGAPYTDSLLGCSYLVHGGATQRSGAEYAVDSAEATMCGKTEGAYFGYRVGGLNANADGYNDVYATATFYEMVEDGAIYVFLGPMSGNISASEADVTMPHNEQSGFSAYATDLNSDGADDLLFGGSRWYTLAWFGGGL